MVSATNTLIIKHLPSDLTDEKREELLKYFGAKDVKCISSSVNKYSLVFARFQDERTAGCALHRLHQLDVNGRRLSVEFADGKDHIFLPKEQSIENFENKELAENEKCYNKFLEKLHSWHGIVNFKQPIPGHLKYQYPPPNDLVLLNIAKVLATVPKFYTQVLHLMNKMNLPCPFGWDILPGLNIELSTIMKPAEINNENSEEIGPETTDKVEADVTIDTSESELSSDDDNRQKETIPDQVKIRKKKIMNLPKFVKPIHGRQPSKRKKTKIEEVFEKVAEETEPKKIKPSLSVTNLLNEASPVEKSTDTTTTTGFGYLHPLKKPSPPQTPKDTRDEREEERLEKRDIVCISIEDLEQNRIPEKDRSILPVFNNYAEGAPTSRLYIKNLAKTVTEDDLKFIYNRYLSNEIGASNVLEIRLMQEGRMKGQAFVTLHSSELAHRALKETNGYILKDKPMVVQFARSSSK